MEKINQEEKREEQHEDIIQKMMRYSPIVHFDSSEQYYPVMINDDILKHATLVSDGMTTNEKVVFPKGTVTEEILSQCVNEKASLKWSDEPLTDVLSGSEENSLKNISKRNLSLPLYCHYQPGNSSLNDKHRGLSKFTYIFMFLYNANYNLFGCCSKIGAHQFDIEHISVFVDESVNEKGIVKQVYYASHGGSQGLWVKRNDLEMTGEHVHVYIAKGAHGCYPKKGTFWRLFGAVNDKSDGKIVWNADGEEKVVDITKEKWYNYGGYFGYPDNCRSPKQYSWIDYEYGLSTTVFRRFVGYFYKRWFTGDDFPLFDKIPDPEDKNDKGIPKTNLFKELFKK
jgi:hypothetical protein